MKVLDTISKFWGILIKSKLLKFGSLFLFMSAILNLVSLHSLLAYVYLHLYEWNTTQHYSKTIVRNYLIG